MPAGVGRPEIWMLGSSDFGARLAAAKGLPFAFAQHFSPLPAQAVIKLYRDQFRPSAALPRPKAIVAIHHFDLRVRRTKKRGQVRKIYPRTSRSIATGPPAAAFRCRQ